MKGRTFALSLLLLSGCFGGEGTGSPDDDESVSSPPPDAMANDTVEPTVVVSDTLHLFGDEEISLTPPPAGDPEETPIPRGISFEGGPAPRAIWSHEATANASLQSISAVVWVRLTQQVVSSGEGPLCALNVYVELFEAGETEGSSIAGPLCVRFDTVAEPGDYMFELEEMDFLLAPRPLAPGMRIEVQISQHVEAASTSDVVFVLSGSLEFDTAIVVKGLQEPVAAT